jgi:hypothetical protein
LESLIKILNLFEYIDSSDFNDELGESKLKEINELLPLHYEEYKSNVYGKANNEKIDILKQYIHTIYLKINWIKFYKSAVIKNENNRAFTISEICLFETYDSLVQNLGLINLPYSIFIDEVLIEMKISKSEFYLSNYLEQKNKYYNSNVNESIDSTNLYPFSGLKSKDLFQMLFEFYCNKENKLANFSFIYWKMESDGFFLKGFKPKVYLDWLYENYNFSLNHQIKTLDRCKTDSKENKYIKFKNIVFK